MRNTLAKSFRESLQIKNTVLWGGIAIVVPDYALNSCLVVGDPDKVDQVSRCYLLVLAQDLEEIFKVEKELLVQGFSHCLEL